MELQLQSSLGYWTWVFFSFPSDSVIISDSYECYPFYSIFFLNKNLDSDNLWVCVWILTYEYKIE